MAMNKYLLAVIVAAAGVTALPAGRIEPLRAATRLRPPRTGPHPTRAKAATDPQCLPMTWQITSP